MSSIKSWRNRQEWHERMIQQAPSQLPVDACDCHVHVMGPVSCYPFALPRVYTPGDADEPRLKALHKRLGVKRVVLVQPSVYGTDNRRMMDGLKRLGARARGVAVIDPSIDDASLATMHRAGVRGVRVNIATSGVNDPGEAWRLIEAQARRVAPLGWHVQVFTKAGVIAALEKRIAELPCSLVIDHFGHPDLARGRDEASFQALVRLVNQGLAMVKLSAMERLAGAGRLRLLSPFVQTLAAANSDGILWGSDWPHTGGGRGLARSFEEVEPFQVMDDADAISALFEALPDPAIRQKLFTSNPARLYDFEKSSSS